MTHRVVVSRAIAVAGQPYYSSYAMSLDVATRVFRLSGFCSVSASTHPTQ